MALDILAEFDALVDALASKPIDYAVCGGWAVNIHGHVRATKDIDLLVPAEALDDARQVARQLGFTMEAGPIPFGARTPASRELFRNSKVESGSLLTIDFLVVAPVFADVWRDREAFVWRGKTVATVSLEGLATMKRLAGRKQDLADLEQLGVDDEEP